MREVAIETSAGVPLETKSVLVEDPTHDSPIIYQKSESGDVVQIIIHSEDGASISAANQNSVLKTVESVVTQSSIGASPLKSVLKEGTSLIQTPSPVVKLVKIIGSEPQTQQEYDTYAQVVHMPFENVQIVEGSPQIVTEPHQQAEQLVQYVTEVPQEAPVTHSQGRSLLTNSQAHSVSKGQFRYLLPKGQGQSPKSQRHSVITSMLSRPIPEHIQDQNQKIFQGVGKTQDTVTASSSREVGATVTQSPLEVVLQSREQLSEYQVVMTNETREEVEISLLPEAAQRGYQATGYQASDIVELSMAASNVGQETEITEVQEVMIGN